ncbi:MAG: hypothetical protein ACREDW_02685, partial [Aestuariivirgaceae bacterium]
KSASGGRSALCRMRVLLRFAPLIVIPAQAGIQLHVFSAPSWTLTFVRVTKEVRVREMRGSSPRMASKRHVMAVPGLDPGINPAIS